jgi:hypothetical protein
MSMKKGLFKVFSTRATVGWEDVLSLCRWQLIATKLKRVASTKTSGLRIVIIMASRRIAETLVYLIQSIRVAAT